MVKNLTLGRLNSIKMEKSLFWKQKYFLSTENQRIYLWNLKKNLFVM